MEYRTLGRSGTVVSAQERSWQVVDAVREVAGDRGASPSQVALSWLGARPAVTSVVLEARTVEQLADNMGATDLRLSAEETQRLDDVSAPRMDDHPYGAAGAQQRHRPTTGTG